MAGQIGADHLDGHQPVQFVIARFIHRAHSAFAQALQDLVALTKYGAFFQRSVWIRSSRAAHGDGPSGGSTYGCSSHGNLIDDLSDFRVDGWVRRGFDDERCAVDSKWGATLRAQT